MSDFETVGSFGIDVAGWAIVGLLGGVAVLIIIFFINWAIRRMAPRDEAYKFRPKRKMTKTWPCPKCEEAHIGKWDDTAQHYICPKCKLQFDCNIAN